MAFGEALRATDGATVVLNVDTSQTAKLEQAEAQWRESVGTMSREALKLDLAQDRLKKSLASYGAESAQAKRATIALKDAEEAATRAAGRQEQQTRELTAAQSRQRAGIGGLTKGVAGLAAAYVGVHGLVAGIRSSLEAAREEENVLGQTRLAVEAAGLSWERYAKRIDVVTRAQSRLGFDDEDLLKTFSTFVRMTRDVDKALALNALSADVARARYMDLESASKLVLKAAMGQAGALRRVGIDAEKGATGVELITLLTEQYGRSAEKAADDGVAAQDRLGVALENTSEIVGRRLVPIVGRYTDEITNWLSKAENQRELQRRVNEAVETGEDVIRGLAGALKFTRTMLEPVVDALGGLDKAIEAALILGLVAKARKAAASFGLISAASALTTRKVVADAAIAGAALDAAYRPRGVVAGGAPGGGRRGIPPILTGNPALITAGAIVATAGGGTHRGDRSGRYPLTYDAVRKAAAGVASEEELEILQDELGRYSLANAPDANMARAERRLARLRANTAVRPDDRGGARGPGAIAGQQRGERPPRGLGAPPASTKPTDIATAVERGAERGTEKGASKAAEKERLANERAMDRAMRQAQKAYEQRGHIPGTRAGMRAAALRGVDETLALLRKKQAAKDTEEMISLAEVRRSQVTFLSDLQGITNQFGSNYTDTQLWTQTELMRENNRVIGRLASATHHPGAKFARNELATILGGVGAI